MDRPCIVIVREGISGGTASLSFRIIMALREKGFDCMYFCRQINDESNYNLFTGNGIDVECIDDYSYSKHLLKRCKDGIRYKFLTYSIEENLVVEKLRDKYCNYNIESCLYYVVHHYAFGKKGCSLLEKLISIIKYRILIKLLFSARSILFMSELCLENARSVLSLEMSNADDYVYYLPVKINRFTREQIQAKKRHTPIVISSITRLEFPFKEYVMGLLDWFGNNSIGNINLIIVGDGRDRQLFLKKLNSIDVEKRKRIKYYPNIQYDKLSDIFELSDLYVGMGTTLIDAANNLTLALPVNGYTNKIEVSGLLSENIRELFASGEKKSFDHYIQQLINMSDAEYINQILIQYELFCKTYDIDNFVNYFLYSSYDIKSKAFTRKLKRKIIIHLYFYFFLIREWYCTWVIRKKSVIISAQVK